MVAGASEEVTAKFFVVLSPQRSTAGTGKITAVNVTASKQRPAVTVPAGALLVEVELAVPTELFSLKAKARLTADAAISIKSLREIEASLK